MFPEITRDDIFRLETPRLWLRWPRAADAEAIAQHCSDPDLALKTAVIPHPYGLGDAERFIFDSRAGNTMGEQLVLALAFKQKPNDVIGMIGAHGAPGRGATRLGFWLGKPHWNQGLMGEAASAFVDLLFSVTSVQTIEAVALATNAAARRIHEKLGFVSCGVDEDHAPARGGVVSVERMRLSRGAAHTSFGARRAKLTSS
jgi:RimJ/RimL family protein N-acetyltransferase